MATVERFEDLEIWKLSRELVNMIYEVTSDNRFAKDYGLKDQIRRSSVSIMNNIAEGFESRTVTYIAHDRIFWMFFSFYTTWKLMSIISIRNKITLYSCYEICPCTSLKPKCFAQRTWVRLTASFSLRLAHNQISWWEMQVAIYQLFGTSKSIMRRNKICLLCSTGL